MIRKLRAGMMPPPSVQRSPGGRSAQGVRRVARDAHRSRGRRRAESGLAAVPAAESRGIRARGSRSARGRRGRHGVSAARHDQPGLRQRRGRRSRSRRRSSRVTCAPPARSAAWPSATARRPRVQRRTAWRKTRRRCQHVDGAPFGTRGGVSVVHTFPADGEYVVQSRAAPHQHR